MKPIHANTMKKSYEFFKSPEGKNIIMSGWRAAGMTEALRDARDNSVDSLLDPFADLCL